MGSRNKEDISHGWQAVKCSESTQAPTESLGPKMQLSLLLHIDAQVPINTATVT